MQFIPCQLQGTEQVQQVQVLDGWNASLWIVQQQFADASVASSRLGSAGARVALHLPQDEGIDLTADGSVLQGKNVQGA